MKGEDLVNHVVICPTSPEQISPRSQIFEPDVDFEEWDDATGVDGNLN